MPEEELKLIGDRIRERRTALRMTLMELEDRLRPYNLGLDHSDLSKIELGKRRLKLEYLPLLCKILVCDYAAILGPIPD